MIKRYILLLPALAMLMHSNSIQAQENITGVAGNARLTGQPAAVAKNTAVVRLPFLDDFSVPAIYPDQNRWADRFAFVNNDYPFNPVTVGVATLDAINDTGAVYQDGGSFTFIADYLTSNPIRLDSLFTGTPRKILKSDSLYLSFFYQPQGIGNKPNDDDSLILEFYSAGDSSWNYVWSAPGMALNDFITAYGAPFRQVIIPITDSTAYFNPEFRFRFYNYASLANNSIPSWSGNVDQWHLDYIYLNVNRSLFDTVYNDVGFVSSAHTVLANYTAMPWKQYNAAPPPLMADSFQHKITNIDNITYNTTYQYLVQEETGVPVSTYSGGNINLQPFAVSGYQAYQPHAKPPVNFSFPVLSGDTAFIITHILEMVGSTDDNRNNDTIRYYQRFYNYYSYDDGTAEAGYGLSLANGRVACQFEAFQPDSLQSIQMFFNHTLNNANVSFFYLTVWDDNQGKPGNVIYEESYQLPKFSGVLNGFVTYDLEPAVWVSGKFYIGWRQTTSDNLNLGFDLNNDRRTRNFYNTSGSWENSLYSGSLMIRPILGLNKEAHVGIPEEDEATTLRVYPNPSAGDYINLDFGYHGHDEEIVMAIFDIGGRLLMKSQVQPQIDITNLPSGIYSIIITNGNGILARQKFVVAR